MPTKRCRLCTNRDAVFEMWKITLLDYHLFKRDIFTAFSLLQSADNPLSESEVHDFRKSQESGKEKWSV